MDFQFENIKRDNPTCKYIIKKVYEISGRVNNSYIDDIIEDYDEIFLFHKNTDIISICIIKNNLNSMHIKLLCSKSGNGAKMIENCKTISRNRSYKFISLESIVESYGFYRKVGFYTSYSDLDDIWDKIDICDTYEKNKKNTLIEKRILRHNKCRSNSLMEKIPIYKKVSICNKIYNGDVKMMFNSISNIIPDGLLIMKLDIK